MTPDDKAFFAGKSSFQCRDGSKTLPIAKLNDDFCDCPDGTDEPGTSACPLGRFYCANKGHIPLVLPSSRVNDGICDCCDGSDEYNGWVPCPKRCAEAGAEARKQLVEQVQKYKEGSKLRAASVAGAQHQKQAWQARLQMITTEKAELEVSEKQLKEAKEAVEKAEKEEREWREKMEKEQQERERLEREGRQKAEAQQQQGQEQEGHNQGESRQQQGQGHEEQEKAEDVVKLQSESGVGGEEEDVAGIAEEAALVAELEAAGYTPPGLQGQDTQAPPHSPSADISSEDGGDEHVDLDHMSKEELGRRVAERWVHHQKEEEETEPSPAVAAAASGGAGGEGDTGREGEDITQLSKEEIGRRVAERWTGHSETESVYKEEADHAEDGDDEESMLDEDVDEDMDEDDMVHDSDHDYMHQSTIHDEPPASTTHQSEDEPPSDDAVSPRATWWARMLQWPKDVCSRIYSLVKPSPAPPELNRTEAARVKKEYAEVEKKLRKLRDEEQSLRSKVDSDFGPEGEFTDLADKCFDIHIQHYIYQVCPFKHVVQKEGHSHTTVGNWRGFTDSYSVMVFDNGDHCWNGPSRSMKVSLLCGMKTEVTAVEEPSRCEYSALMTTPAVCSEAKAKELEDELIRQQQELAAAAHDEL